jgi:anaerobic selenocysteine-containing dehydrogenase
LVLPELLAVVSNLGEPEVDPDYPFVLAAGERRAFTANTIIRNPAWRRRDTEGALRMSPSDALEVGVETGGRVRVTTRRGSVEVTVEVSDTMQAGHISLPNGLGLSFPGTDGAGVAPNELTSSEHRDPFAGTPLHKAVSARLEALPA